MVGAHVGWVVFNPEVGVEVTGLLLGSVVDGRPPRHALTLSGQAVFNPTLRPLRLASGGDTLGAYAAGYVGYAWHSRPGFAFGAQAGALLYADGGFAAGPNATLSAGWVF